MAYKKPEKFYDAQMSVDDDDDGAINNFDDEPNFNPMYTQKGPEIVASFGESFESLVNISPQPPAVKDMKSSEDHILMIVPFKYDRTKSRREPDPINPSDRFDDRWDFDHVHMPCSPKNIDKFGAPKWPPIRSELKYLQSLCKAGIATIEDLERTIERCSSRPFDLSSLRKSIEQYKNDDRRRFMSEVLPSICSLAMDIDKICSRSLPLLRIGSNKAVTMSQKQAASILACQFFCLFPARFDRYEDRHKFRCFPRRISFHELYETGSKKKVEKIRCILNYFSRITSQMPTGVITFQRCHLKKDRVPNWSQSSQPICDIHMTSNKKIEEIYNVLQVDFANKYIGGGVLGNGCVQEEIRFTICPEMLVSLLICERMEENECIFLIGCEQFSMYEGYSDSFEFARDYLDPTYKDDWGRKWCHLVAMDAIFYRNPSEQYLIESVDRELTKAFASFRPLKDKDKYRFPIATGSWGCGAFNGDKGFKAIIQIIAASEAKRPVIYAAYRDVQFLESLNRVYTHLKKQKTTVRHLYKYLQKYIEKQEQKPLFDFILETPMSFSDQSYNC